MSTRGYGSYRGRTPLKRFGKIFIILLVVIVAFCVVAGIYLQQFLVISDEGVRLDLPFTQQDEPTPSPTPSVPEMDIPVTVAPTPTPTPTPVPVSNALLPVLLPTEALYNGSALRLMDEAGGDCALFDMKTDQGTLNFISTQENAVSGNLNPDTADRNTAIQALNETDGLYTIARVSCFKDHGLIQYDYDLAIHTNSGYRWTDPDGIRWSSPTNPDVRDYLTEICVELAQLGFDEILLDHAGYPCEGNLHYIKKGDAYNASQFSSVIDGFYAQIVSALTDYDVKLSVVTTQEALSGTDTLTGQSPENLKRFDRLWTVTEAGLPAPLEAFPTSP